MAFFFFFLPFFSLLACPTPHYNVPIWIHYPERNFLMSFGSQLRTLRQIKGWTQFELADASGVHRSKIAQYETDVSKPSWDSAIKLANALQVDLNDFLDKPEAKPSRQKTK